MGGKTVKIKQETGAGRKEDTGNQTGGKRHKRGEKEKVKEEKQMKRERGTRKEMTGQGDKKKIIINARLTKET